eukprot:TRINITY_DN10031_c0_g1_i1.p1 TRINITY_DN10031_c0_g1~~TRINITY_DN10031_c0_g1_i1.p1  ORF type:complete len:375 (+),score=85.21 TRINITY_DN10031_c0_g1_i1:3-1127(+)
MSGHLGSLSPDQERILSEMLRTYPASAKAGTSPEEHKAELLRFLRARQFNLANASQMYAASLVWRAEVGADRILDQPDPLERLFHEVIPHGYHKYDKRGRPVYFEKTGMINITEMTSKFTSQQLITRHIHFLESMVQLMKSSPATKRGEHVEQMVMIQDLAGLSLSLTSHVSVVNVFRTTTSIDQNYYPERMGKMIMIRAPQTFAAIWSWISTLLDPVTKEKIVILGNDYQSALLELIDADSLPEEYGGTCKCVPACIEQNQSVSLPHKITVNAGAVSVFEVPTGAEGGLLEIFFKTESKDIALSVSHHAHNESPVVLQTSQRYTHAYSFPNKAIFAAHKPGKFLVSFDNSYSFFSAKTVSYRYDLSAHDKPSQ